jgi:hypothetical protein
VTSLIKPANEPPSARTASAKTEVQKASGVDAVARTGLDRQEAYMLLSIIGELRVGTSRVR